MNSVTASIHDRIRSCVHAEPPTAILTGDFSVAGGQVREDRPLTAAAVLVGLVKHGAELAVLLTQRTDHLHHHGGQISFPGGRVEAHDVSPVETALRETEEEIGLDRCHVEIVGFLDLYQTVTGFLVTPVVSFIEPDFELQPDPFEVAEVFEVPLDFILDPRNQERRSIQYQGRDRYFYVIPYQNRYIWGATAAMLVGFARRLAEW
jgi:8-oxo-dGTP pyrophosphatase MutT (NUDIX family)